MRILLGITLCLLSLSAAAQEKCVTVAYNERLEKLSGSPRLSGTHFESWLAKKQAAHKQQRQAYTSAQAAPYVIPVVVHVVHRSGDAEGQGSNIPREQILSQIEILNVDFAARNTAEIDGLPQEFKALASNTEIEFVLARQTPEGLPTDGIVRIASTENSWMQARDAALKSLSHWPSDKYLNLYVADLGGSTIGWAQFPQSDELPGLDFGDIAEETDGVVVDYAYMGKGYNAASGSTGRTATHEIGHYFGLRHIWGDGGCQQDDYVTDTPPTDHAHQGCPESSASCSGGPAMYQNYMDYTADRCMALFTNGQRERMHIVLENSPRRKDLPHSPGKLEPTVVANDAGIRSLQLNVAKFCDGGVVPVVQLRNYGNTSVQQVTVELRVNGQAVNSYSLTTNLDYLQEETFQLEELLLSHTGMQQVTAHVVRTNNQPDGKELNNVGTASVLIPHRTELPAAVDFESGFTSFYTVNPDFSYSWKLSEAPNGLTPDNTAAFFNCYDYPAVGQKDILASPILDLRTTQNAFLSFRVAHARYDRQTMDGLQIYVTSDCRADLSSADLVYEAFGDDLATSPPTTGFFIPGGPSQWQSLFIDLSAYAGLENIQVLFVGVNDYGNNIYLDDIQLIKTLATPLNVSLSKIEQPSTIQGATTAPISVELHNLGTEVVESLSFRVTVDGQVVADREQRRLNFTPGSSRTFELNPIYNLAPGAHVINVQAYAPNGLEDDLNTDNSLTKNFLIDSSQKNFPLRESLSATTFEESSWSTISPATTGTGWELANSIGPYHRDAADNFAARAEYQGNIRSNEKWLASPIFDMREVRLAGMQFWHYTGGDGQYTLQVLASTDGGVHWSEILWEKSHTELSPDSRVAPMEPGAMSSWQKEFINLQPLLGQEQVRLAFVVKGQGNSAVYVDEIEFFLSDQPANGPVLERNDVVLFPNPSKGKFQLAFNMEAAEGEEVNVELFNSSGSFISKNRYPNTLNQIYTIDVTGIPAGIYYLRINSPSIKTTRRLVVVP